ncbi:hypothetical protein JCM6882_003296 [Rhodosporidiobolus microsporus]
MLPTLDFAEMSELTLDDIPFDPSASTPIELPTFSPFLGARPSTPPSPPLSPTSELIYRPAVPIDVINHVVDLLETSLSAAKAKQEGKRLSLVSRDFRDAGQRLVFRRYSIDGLSLYSRPDLFVVYGAGGDPFSFNSEDFSLIKQFRDLSTFNLVFPLALAAFLPRHFPDDLRLSVRAFGLELTGDAVSSLDHALGAFLSLPARESLAVFALVAPTTTLHVQRWLAGATSLRSLRLALSADPLTTLVPLIQPTLPALSSLHSLRLEQRGDHVPRHLAGADLALFLSHLPESLETMHLDVCIVGRSLWGGASYAWDDFLEARLTKPLKEVKCRRLTDPAKTRVWKKTEGEDGRLVWEVTTPAA